MIDALEATQDPGWNTVTKATTFSLRALSNRGSHSATASWACGLPVSQPGPDLGGLARLY